MRLPSPSPFTHADDRATESESLAELDNFVHVMLTIWDEIQEVKNGEATRRTTCW